jgi:hypothetical protein
VRSPLHPLEDDLVRAAPQHQLAKRAQRSGALDDRQEVVAGQLADDAGKPTAAIGKQQLGLADAGISQHLARCRVAGGVLKLNTDVQIAERYSQVARPLQRR